MAFNEDMISRVYSDMKDKVETAKEVLGRPLTLVEKVLYAHLWRAKASKEYNRGGSYVNFAPDRVAMQDATAQMALLQFMQAGRNTTAVPSTVHCDHLILGKENAKDDLSKSLVENKEVFDFLASVSNKYGIDFWQPGSGIIHQVILENYAFPGGLMIGADSHTVNAGGLGMIAIGVGGADIVDVMVGMSWELLFPKLVGVKLTGKMNGWTSAKDVILKLAGIMTVKGGTGRIVEYFGEGAESISCTGKGTICNMGAEIGATTSVFGYDEKMSDYLKATDRANIAEGANAIAEHLTGDREVYEDPEKYFDEVIEIDLSTLEPHINGPFTPDNAIPISEIKKTFAENDWPEKLEVGLIGSCTNSSYEDMTRSASIARQAKEKGLIPKSEFFISPGSEQIRYTIERDGLVDTFEEIGGRVFANACGPCIGQWARHSDDPKKKNTIITSFNRNFAKRNDGNPNTHAFVSSPELVTAMVLAGTINFNPLTDKIKNVNGEEVMLEAPVGSSFPEKGFAVEDRGYRAPTGGGEVVVSPDSKRLQLLKPFLSNSEMSLNNMHVLIKAKGKCTTDHISMAGPWLRFRGHLDNISDNTLTGAVNAFNDEVNKVKNVLSGDYGAVPEVARAYKAASIGTIVVGDENYGEGSSREHAAMQPRSLGVRVVLVRSFARIHETNLKKQGILAVTFSNKADYDKIQEDDKVSITNFGTLTPGKPIEMVLRHSDGNEDTLSLNHTYNDAQIAWFKEGSALNLIKKTQSV